MQAGPWPLTLLAQVFKANSLLLEDFPGLERLQFSSTVMKQWAGSRLWRGSTAFLRLCTAMLAICNVLSIAAV